MSIKLHNIVSVLLLLCMVSLLPLNVFAGGGGGGNDAGEDGYISGGYTYDYHSNGGYTATSMDGNTTVTGSVGSDGEFRETVSGGGGGDNNFGGITGTISSGAGCTLLALPNPITIGDSVEITWDRNVYSAGSPGDVFGGAVIAPTEPSVVSDGGNLIWHEINGSRIDNGETSIVFTPTLGELTAPSPVTNNFSGGFSGELMGTVDPDALPYVRYDYMALTDASGVLRNDSGGLFGGGGQPGNINCSATVFVKDGLGCMDPTAVNYDPDAFTDDGSCEFWNGACHMVTAELPIARLSETRFYNDPNLSHISVQSSWDNDFVGVYDDRIIKSNYADDGYVFAAHLNRDDAYMNARLPDPTGSRWHAWKNITEENSATINKTVRVNNAVMKMTYQRNQVDPRCAIDNGTPDPSATITATDCEIGEGESTCTTDLTWDASDPLITDPKVWNVTTNSQVSVDLIGTDQPAEIEYGNTYFSVLDGGTTLAINVANADCVLGTTWNNATHICESGGTGVSGVIDGNTCTISIAGMSTCQGNINWQTSGVASVSVTNNKSVDSNIYNQLTKSVQFVRLGLGNTTYTLNGDGSVLDTKTLNVTCGTGLAPIAGACEVSSGPPVLTAEPSIVRKGGEVTIEWDPGGYAGCTLSSNLSGSDGTVAGSLVKNLTSTATYTYTCTGIAPESVTVQVLPVLYES